MWFLKKKNSVNKKTTDTNDDNKTTVKTHKEKEDKRINPPEIMRLENYFNTLVGPSYLYETDGDEDRTNINWLSLRGESIEKSVYELVSFRPHLNKYDHKSLDTESSCILWRLRNDKSFFIIDSFERLPKDKDRLEKLKRICSENSIGIVELISKGIYHEYVEEKYYRVEVDEKWPGMVDDAATYGAYHIYEITEIDAKKDYHRD